MMTATRLNTAAGQQQQCDDDDCALGQQQQLLHWIVQTLRLYLLKTVQILFGRCHRHHAPDITGFVSTHAYKHISHI